MSGSRLGRGRTGRLALLGCAALAVLFVVFLYRSASSEMARLRDLHVKCAQQQEALAAQLQVIYEYKVQLEKTLSNEKDANEAVKEELQKKASRERECDKNSREAIERYNSLQQNYKLLQTEHEDLKDDCKKKEDVALKNAKNLEATLQELRIELKKAAEAKKKAEDERKYFEEDRKSFEHMKNKYMQIVEEKEQLEEKYNSLKKTTGENNGNVEKLQKQVVQLKRELEEVRKSPHFSVGSVKPAGGKQLLPRHANGAGLSIGDGDINNQNNNENKSPGLENNQMQVIRPSSQQQTSVSASNAAKAAVPGPPAPQSPSESSGKVTSASPPIADGNKAVNRLPTKVKLPLGVPPIPQLIESKDELAEPARKQQQQQQQQQQESAGQAPPLRPEESLGAEVEPKKPKLLEESANVDDDALLPQNGEPNGNARHMGEQILDRHEADNWYKLKPGVQEVGDPHHIEKSGFENVGGNEDVEQYDDYNSKELQNKNGDLHIEEGEDEREDEDYDMHNNVNAVKHE